MDVLRKFDVTTEHGCADFVQQLNIFVAHQATDLSQLNEAAQIACNKLDETSSGLWFLLQAGVARFVASLAGELVEGLRLRLSASWSCTAQ